MFCRLLLFIIYSACAHAIYDISDEDYAKMPPLYYRDDYSSCINEGARYCTVEFHLRDNGSSSIYQMILKYSAHSPTCFNYTRLQYGLCVTHACTKFSQETAEDQSDSLEACLNETLYKKYSLSAKVIDYECNDDMKTNLPLDIWDIAVAIVCIALLVFNIIGSLQEMFLRKADKGNKFLSCFSIQHNWEKLTAPLNYDGVQDMKPLYGIRTMIITTTICCHVLLIFINNVQNPKRYEEIAVLYFKYSGTVMVQTFFIMSGLLMAQAIQNQEKHHRLTPVLVAKGLFIRWLRFLPTYLFVFAISTTWIRFVDSGPLWQNLVVKHTIDCRRDWWSVITMTLNYKDDSRCLPETWTIQGVMQLTAISLVLCLFTGKKRVLALTLLFISGMVAVAVHTYLLDLDAIFILRAEPGRNIFCQDPTFNNIHKRGHTNASAFTAGLAAGFQLLRVNRLQLHKSIADRIVFWLMFPLSMSVMFAGSIFYTDLWPGSLLLRVSWAVLHKIIFALFMTCLIVGLLTEIDNFYRKIFGWRGFIITGRLSFCGYLINMVIVRIMAANMTKLITVTQLNIVGMMLLVVFLTFASAYPLWLLVEAPGSNLISLYVEGRKSKSSEERKIRKKSEEIKIRKKSEERKNRKKLRKLK